MITFSDLCNIETNFPLLLPPFFVSEQYTSDDCIEDGPVAAVSESDSEQQHPWHQVAVLHRPNARVLSSTTASNNYRRRIIILGTRCG